MATESALASVLKDAIIAELKKQFPAEAAIVTVGTDVATVLAKTVSMAVEVGPLDPKVWIVALEEGAREFASEELAKQWLAAGNVLANRFNGT